MIDGIKNYLTAKKERNITKNIMKDQLEDLIFLKLELKNWLVKMLKK